MQKSGHILNAATNLLGIALVIIASLHITNRSSRTISDEVAWGAALCFSASALLSYLSLRALPHETRFEDWADQIFLVGMALLLGSVVILGFAKLG